MIDASVVFAADGPPEARTIAAWRLTGSGDGPCAVLQAGVHADEIPPMLVLHHLLPKLRQAEAEGSLRGDITVIPQANPIGIRQFTARRLLGRFDAATGRNFNRDFGRAAADPTPGIAAWQAVLLGLSDGADIVLDLHTDDEALPYVYLHTALWPDAADLPGALGAEATILWDGEGGGAFEEAVIARWLAEPQGVTGRLAATVELRGQADVDDAIARRDAEALFRLLRGRGVIAGGDAVASWRGETVPIQHMQTIRAPHAGVLVFTHALGDRLGADEPFARLVTRPGDPAADVVLAAPNAGRLLTRMRDRYVDAGGIVAKLTGAEPFPLGTDGPLDD